MVLRAQIATKDEVELVYVSSFIYIHIMIASEAEGSREVVCQPRYPSMGWPRSCLLSVATPQNLERLITHLLTHRGNKDKTHMHNDQLRKSYPTSYSEKHLNQEVQNEVTFLVIFMELFLQHGPFA